MYLGKNKYKFILCMILIYSVEIFCNSKPKLQTRALCASTLTEIDNSPFAVVDGNFTRYVAYSSNGNFLEISSRFGGLGNGFIGTYSVDNSNGEITFIQNFSTTAQQPFGLSFFPNGDFLSFVNQNDNSITTAKVNANGTLTFSNNVSSGGNFPTFIAISPNGKFAAVNNNLVSNTVSYFKVDSNNGSLNLGGSTGTQVRPFELKYFLNGQFLAVVNTTSDSVTIYSVDQATGQPIPINGTVVASSFATQDRPRRIAISTDNKFAAITNDVSNTVTIYSINQITGAFTPVTGSLATSSFATGNNPNGVAYAPDNSMLIVANENTVGAPGGDTISVYNINSDGTLSFITTYPVGSNANTVAFSPNSVYVAVANAFDNTVSIFATTLMANPISGDTNCNQPITIQANACGTQLKVSSVSNPVNGSATFSGLSITYTPNQGFNGTDSFTYTVSDSAGRTVSSSATINVAINAQSIKATTPQNTPITINTALFSCGNSISITQPTHGTAQVNGKLVIYTPNNNFIGIDTFTYTVDDGMGNTQTATITITVTSTESYIVRLIRQKYCKLI